MEVMEVAASMHRSGLCVRRNSALRFAMTMVAEAPGELGILPVYVMTVRVRTLKNLCVLRILILVVDVPMN